jgi:hypothetical protein
MGRIRLNDGEMRLEYLRRITPILFNPASKAGNYKFSSKNSA